MGSPSHELGIHHVRNYSYNPKLTVCITLT